MKKTIITAACALASVAAFGQGTFYFASNINGQGTAGDNAIVLPKADGTAAPVATGTPADSPYQAEVAINGNLIPSSITPMTSGYILGPTITVAGTPAGNTVSYQVYVWNPANGATYAIAAGKAGDIVGTSGLIASYTTGGVGSPPSSPPAMGFAPFSLTAVPSPEPTTLALGAMGLGAALLFRRKK